MWSFSISPPLRAWHLWITQPLPHCCGNWIPPQWSYQSTSPGFRNAFVRIDFDQFTIRIIVYHGLEVLYLHFKTAHLRLFIGADTAVCRHTHFTSLLICVLLLFRHNDKALALAAATFLHLLPLKFENTGHHLLSGQKNRPHRGESPVWS